MSKTRLCAIAAVVAVVAGGCGNSTGVGEPGAPTKADRVVEIHTLGTLRFSPDTVTAKAGETVTFRLVNDDTTFHEFMIADAKTHAEHDKEMAAMSPEPMAMADEKDAITMRAGQTKELTWTFSKKGTVIFACHQPGHYAAGMKGTVTVS